MKLSPLATFALLIVILLSGCRSSSDVVSERLIQKRKYRSGFFVAKRASQPAESGRPKLSDVQTRPLATISGEYDSTEDHLSRKNTPVKLEETKTLNTREPASEPIEEAHAEASLSQQPNPSTTDDQSCSESEDHWETTGRGEGVAYNKNTGRIGLVLFIAGIVATVTGSIVLGTATLSAGTTASAVAVTCYVLGSLMMIIGMVMMTIHLVRLFLDA